MVVGWVRRAFALVTGIALVAVVVGCSSRAPEPSGAPTPSPTMDCPVPGVQSSDAPSVRSSGASTSRAADASPSHQGRQRRTLNERMDDWIVSILGPDYWPYEPDYVAPEGYGGVRLRLKKHLVVFAWKGAPPPDVARKLANPPRGVRVEVLEAPYTQWCLHKAQEVLRDHESELESSTGWSVSFMATRQNGQGLWVGVWPAEGQSQMSLDAVRQVFADTGGVPVVVERMGPTVPTAREPGS